MSQVHKEAGRAVVKPGKNVVASMAPDFKQELQTLCDERHSLLVIDLDGVGMMDSVGIGVIIAAHNTISKSGGRLQVVNVLNDIYQVLVAMRLNHHFDIEKAA